MKYVAAVVMGFLSGYLIYLASGLLPVVAQIALLIDGWAASSYLLLRGAQTTSTVLARGFLLGATEWLVIIVAIIIHALYTTEAQHIEWAPIRLAAALLMAILCLGGYAVIRLWAREMKPDQPERSPSSM